MSLESWKQLYYPITAEEAAKLSSREIIQHSLTKWIGLRKTNLDRHGVWKSVVCLLTDGSDTPKLSITGSTCSLCARYYDPSADEPASCASCTLAQLGKSGTDCFKEYIHWRDTADPEPMIALLERALQTAEAN